MFILLIFILTQVNSRAVLWNAMDYKGLNVRSWENGLIEAARREIPIMVIFLESTRVDGGIRKVYGFIEDKAWFEKTKKFVVVTADDTDDIFTQTLGEYEKVPQPYPKITFFHYNGIQFDIPSMKKDFVYEDSFELNDVMDDILDKFEDGYVPEKKEL